MPRSRKTSHSSRLPNTPRSIAPSPLPALSTFSNLSNSTRPPSTTDSSNSFGISLPSPRPTPSTTSIRRPSSLFTGPPSAIEYSRCNMPSPSPSSIFAPKPYTQYPEFLAPSPNPISSNTFSLALPSPGSGSAPMPTNGTREQHQAYAHFCRQIQEIFRNMAAGVLGAGPGIQNIGGLDDDSTTVQIPTTHKHRRLAAQVSAAVSSFCRNLPLLPVPPFHERGSEEDVGLNGQTLWIISFPHDFAPSGEMRSGLTDYFRNADRNLKILCQNDDWGFLARRCRRRFAKFIEEIPGFGFEAMFHDVEGEYFAAERHVV